MSKPLINEIEQDVGNAFSFIKGLFNKKCIYCDGTGFITLDNKSVPCTKCNDPNAKAIVKP